MFVCFNETATTELYTYCQPLSQPDAFPFSHSRHRSRRRNAPGEQAEFTPGPTPILTPPRQAAFLENLMVWGNARLACKAAAVSPQTAYRERRRSPAFAALWDAALLSARQHAEEVLADRALSGVEEAVFYHGEEVARRSEEHTSELQSLMRIS